MNVAESWIAGMAIQAILFGLYVGTLSHCLRWLLYDDEGWSYRKNINWPMLAIAFIIFLFSAGSLVMVLQIVLEGVRNGSDALPVTISSVSARNLS